MNDVMASCDSPCLNLAPARWIWLPSGRCLPNTFVLFRREVVFDQTPRSMSGWLLADSRYRITVNGQRVQWGPAPSDPRWPEADPVDLTPFLRRGHNVIGVEVVYFGHGDGTWPAGAPGFLMNLEVVQYDGDRQRLVSDAQWMCTVDRSHPPGQYRRWFLRALQEQFDARLQIVGWDHPDFKPDALWIAAQEISDDATLPPILIQRPWREPMGPDGALLHDASPGEHAIPSIRRRSIPLMRETEVSAGQLVESGWVHWNRDSDDWFELQIPGSFTIEREQAVESDEDGSWRLPVADQTTGVFVTFCLSEQMVGFPLLEVEAPLDTVIELIVQESHEAHTGPAWLDTHHHHWSRLICREGLNRFEAFDYESCRWIQLHVRGHERPVTVRRVGLRRREYAWPNEPAVACGEPVLQRLFDAAVNTLRNSCLDTIQDGAGRERQQYSGDCGHQLLTARDIFGATTLAARFIATFSQGLTREGYFLDCWPAYDRLARLVQRHMDATDWGPLLDHGVGFVFDCYQHYMDSGRLADIEPAFPRLLRFVAYLESLRDDTGLLPVTGLGIPTVWLDSFAYQAQRDKQCAFNLYIAGMLRHALAPLCRAFNRGDDAIEFEEWSDAIVAAVIERFWNSDQGLFIINSPWLDQDDVARLCDRSLAMAVLFDQCPEHVTESVAEMLANPSRAMGRSYPCNAVWRYRALMKLRRVDVVLRELRECWATMPSVHENNTIQEFWQTQADSLKEWSHCAMTPLIVLVRDIIGFRPIEPGYSRYEIRPQLGDLGPLDVMCHTPRGPLRFVSDESGLTLTLPRAMEGVLYWNGREQALHGSQVFVATSYE